MREKLSRALPLLAFLGLTACAEDAAQPAIDLHRYTETYGARIYAASARFATIAIENISAPGAEVALVRFSVGFTLGDESFQVQAIISSPEDSKNKALQLAIADVPIQETNFICIYRYSEEEGPLSDLEYKPKVRPLEGGPPKNLNNVAQVCAKYVTRAFAEIRRRVGVHENSGETP